LHERSTHKIGHAALAGRLALLLLLLLLLQLLKLLLLLCLLLLLLLQDKRFETFADVRQISVALCGPWWTLAQMQQPDGTA